MPLKFVFEKNTAVIALEAWPHRQKGLVRWLAWEKARKDWLAKGGMWGSGGEPRGLKRACLVEELERTRRPGGLFCPLIELKIILGLHALPLFGLLITKCLNLAPEWILLFESNPPCIVIKGRSEFGAVPAATSGISWRIHALVKKTIHRHRAG
jgi:hypothetical protein